MDEIKEYFYKRYLKLKLELSTLEKEIDVYKKKYNEEIYSGCKDVKAIDYSKIRMIQETEEINAFYKDLIQNRNIINQKENYKSNLIGTIKKMEDDFKKFSKNFNDIEMEVFIQFFIRNKPLNQILIKKSNGEFYSYIQIKRIKKKISKKIAEN